MMRSFAQAHNDYLDPDRFFPEEPEGLSAAQKCQITKLRREGENLRALLYDPSRRVIPTVESLFNGAPDGDFEWEGEPEDVGNAWNCGGKYRDVGWHQSCQCIDMGRKDGKTWFIVRVDNFVGDGDYQPVGGWDEREGDNPEESLRDLWFDVEGRVIDHFYGWAMYCLDVSLTGEDPLDNFFRSPMPDHCIKAARENIKYLRQMNKEQK